MDEGADVIMPVAGPVGLGTAAAILERSSADAPVWLVGVDTDWTVSAPEYADVTLTSVLKRLDFSVVTASRAVATGAFSGGTKVGNLENGEIGIATSGRFAEVVPAEAQAALETITQGIIDGAIATRP
jgi:basic membrane protein A